MRLNRKVPLVAEHRSPRSGTIPVPLVQERETPWLKISLVLNALLAITLLVSFFSRPAITDDGREKIIALVEKDVDRALEQGEGKLSEIEEATRYWHEFLAREYLKAKKKKQAYLHFSWLVKNYPKNKDYHRGLAAANAKNGKETPKKK